MAGHRQCRLQQHHDSSELPVSPSRLQRVCRDEKSVVCVRTPDRNNNVERRDCYEMVSFTRTGRDSECLTVVTKMLQDGCCLPGIGAVLDRASVRAMAL
jgi:hypothetical protein